MKRAQIIRLILLLVIITIGVFLVNHEFGALYQRGIGIIMLALTGLWLISLAIKDASIIDIFWGFGFVILVWFYASQIGFENMGPRNWVFIALVTAWGLRLTAYLGYRNIGKAEDYRYAQWRADNGKKWWWLSFIRVFALQGFLMWIISPLFIPALKAGGDLQILDYIGIALWAVGFYFEAVGDWQLMRFKKNPDNKGKVMDQGVWRYTRHPNYFGDATMWWAYFLFALAYPWGWVFIFGPAFMNFLLLRVSGVAMLEVKLKKSKPKYAEYIRKTSAFIPMPPKA